jgi:hypothetical protein
MGYNLVSFFNKKLMKVIFSYIMLTCLCTIYFKLDISYNKIDMVKSWIYFPTMSFYFGAIFMMVLYDVYSFLMEDETKHIYSIFILHISVSISFIYKYYDIWFSIPMLIILIEIFINNNIKIKKE